MVVTLQGIVEFPVGVEVFMDYEVAKQYAERIQKQYEKNRVYIIPAIIN